MEEYIAPKEASKILCVEQSTLRRWYGQGLLASVPIRITLGGQRRYEKTAIEQLANARPWERKKPLSLAEVSAPNVWAQAEEWEDEVGVDVREEDELWEAASWQGKRTRSGALAISPKVLAVAMDEGEPSVEDLIPSAAELIPDLDRGIDLGDRVYRSPTQGIDVYLPIKKERMPLAQGLMNMPGVVEIEDGYVEGAGLREHLRKMHEQLRAFGWEVEAVGYSWTDFLYTKTFDDCEEAIEDARYLDFEDFTYQLTDSSYSIEVVMCGEEFQTFVHAA